MGRSCEGRVALVTGASRGIGRGIALRLAAEGAAVALVARHLHDDRYGASLSRVVAEIEARGGRAVAIAADLADPSQPRDAIVDRVEAELGAVDILVNNAAVATFRPFAEWTDSRLRAVLEVNVIAPWQLAQRVLPSMRARGEGWILNISSGAAEPIAGRQYENGGGQYVVTQGTAYGGSKAMLNRWTASLAAELRGTGVVVNTLAPNGAVTTEAIEADGFPVPEDKFEPLETIAEAALALCTGDLTGRIAYNLPLLLHLDRPVYDLTGTELLADWQPADLPERIAAQHIERPYAQRWS